MQRARIAREPRVDPPGLLLSVVAGVVAALLLAGAVGTALVVKGPDSAWSSQVSLVVRPTAEQSDAAKAGYYENLSNGQVVQTYAEVLRSRNLGGVAGGEGPTSQVLVVPDTFLLRIVLEAETRELAVARGEQAGSEAVAAIEALEQPYTLDIVGTASDNVQETGGLDPALLAAAALGAVLYGVGVQQLVWFIQRRRYDRRGEDLLRPHSSRGHALTPEPSPERPAVR